MIINKPFEFAQITVYQEVRDKLKIISANEHKPLQTIANEALISYLESLSEDGVSKNKKEISERKNG